MFGNCCNTCCPADSNRGLFGICLNDATLVIILLAIWLLSSGGLSGYGGGCGCNTCGGGLPARPSGAAGSVMPRDARDAALESLLLMERRGAWSDRKSVV